MNGDVCKDKGGPLLDVEEAARANRHLDSYNALLLEVAARTDVEVVRLDELDLELDPDNFYDCMHPSDDGYKIVADAWHQYVR